MYISKLKIQSILGTRAYVLIDDFIVEFSEDETYTVPCGFKTDLISSPRWAWSYIPPGDRGKEAAVLHDYLLEQGRPRKECDKIFDRVLKGIGIKPLKKWCMFRGVRLRSKKLKIMGRVDA